MLQLTTDIAMGFNHRKPPDRTAVDLSAVFDTVCHNTLLSKKQITSSPGYFAIAISEEDKPRLALEV